MLQPEYFNDKADRMIEIYQELENYILQDIADRLLKSQSVSGTADRMIWKLQQMGESRESIMNKLSQITGLSRRELKTLLQDAVMTSWDDDLSTFNQLGIQVVNPLENATVMSVMNAEYIKSQGELENLTRTTMNQAVKDLGRMLDDAEMRVASGLQSYSSAVCEILDNYAGRGLMIDYPTGTRRSLEAAVRMCVVTSMNQTSAQITNQYIVEGNIEYVLVSAHQGARIQQPGQPYLAGHENWQGKVCRIRGSEPGYPNLAELTGYDIDNSGKGKVLNPLGLHGYNCRHSHKPWDKDLRNPYVDENGKLIIDTQESRELYEKQQKQRAMERSIRKTKRQLLMKQEEIDKVAETDVKDVLQGNYDRIAYKLRQQNAAYNKFCEENGLHKQSDRLKVAGFKRAQSSKASGRARAYEHWKNSTELGKLASKSDKILEYGYKGNARFSSGQKMAQYMENLQNILDKSNGNQTMVSNIKAMMGYEWYVDKNVGSFMYDPTNDKLLYNPDVNLEDFNMNAVLVHEMAHKLDVQVYKSWENKGFIEAINKTKDYILQNKSVFESALAQGGQYYANVELNDIISAITRGEISTWYSHEASYWNDITVAAEIFANLTSVDLLHLNGVMETDGFLNLIYDSYLQIVEG